MLILITRIYVCAYTNTHIYIWLLASSSHCMQLAFTLALLSNPPHSCEVTSFFPCWLSEGQWNPLREGSSWAQTLCDIAPAPAATSKVTDGQLQPPSHKWVVCPLRAGARSGNEPKPDWASGAPVPNGMLREHDLVKSIWLFIGIRVTLDILA